MFSRNCTARVFLLVPRVLLARSEHLQGRTELLRRASLQAARRARPPARTRRPRALTQSRFSGSPQRFKWLNPKVTSDVNACASTPEVTLVFMPWHASRSVYVGERQKAEGILRTEMYTGWRGLQSALGM